MADIGVIRTKAVGPLQIKITVDPAFRAALDRAIAAIEAFGEQMKRADLVTVELSSEGHGG